MGVSDLQIQVSDLQIGHLDRGIRHLNWGNQTPKLGESDKKTTNQTIHSMIFSYLCCGQYTLKS